jgi:hypothetical protein
MDQSALVTSAHALMKELDAAEMPPQLAMLVHSTDTDTWKLWIVPPAAVKDKHEFYRRVAEIITKHRAEVGGLSASDVEMIPTTHPAVEGLSTIVRMDGFGSVHFSGNQFNGFYLPDGIILRSAVERRATPRTS